MSIDDQDLRDDLARVAEELQRAAELIDASDGWLAADDGVDAVHSIVRSSAHALRALAGWYERCSEQIFDERLGAEQDATKAVAAAERALRAFAAELEAVAERHAGLVAEVDHLDHRDVYALAEHELGESGEAYAVREITGETTAQVSHGLYEREDVARAEARARARDGSVGSVYRVVAVTDGAPDSTVAQWPGEGQRRAVRTLAPASAENSLSRFALRLRLRSMSLNIADVRAVPAWLGARSQRCVLVDGQRLAVSGERLGANTNERRGAWRHGRASAGDPVYGPNRMTN